MNRTVSILLALTVAGSAWAQQTTEAGQTTITSKRLTFDYKRSIAIFEEDVVVVDPQLRIEADNLTVLFAGESEIKAITASGNVRIRETDRTATCEKAIYIAKRGELLLTGNAKVMRGRDSVSGRKITFWLNEDRMECEPGRLIIHSPESGETGAKDRLRF